ncbi:MAG: response regulator [Phycisphaerales bacterium]|nr:response regulator [Phycisphaerales bacterium]
MEPTTHNILVVDDSATTRAVVKRTIALSGAAVGDVFEAGDGNAALGVIRSRKVDLVLLDLHMPGMGGVELAGILHGDPATRDIPIVVISAEPSAGRIEALKAGGVRGYVRKPFRPEQVRDVIHHFLGGGQ